MLTIRKQQMMAFKANALMRYEQQLMMHALKFAPRHSASMGEQQLQLCVHTAVLRAHSRGFTLLGPVRLWLELSFMFGIDFDTDPQLHTFVNVISDASTLEFSEQLSCAGNLRTRSVDFVERINGSDCGHERAAVKRARDLSLGDLSIQVEETMIGLLHRIYPEKVDAVGTSALKQLIKEARSQSQIHELNDPAAPMAMTLLMFTFGHGCIADPLFPWISDLLSRFELDVRERLKHMHRKSLRFILTGFEGD